MPGNECTLRITGTLIEFLRHLTDNDYLQDGKNLPMKFDGVAGQVEAVIK